MKAYITFFIAICLAFYSCSNGGFEAEVPTYLEVEPFTFNLLVDQGSASTDIRDVWVYDGSELLGAYELPAKVPLLGDDPKQIILFPGVRSNGNSLFPDIFFIYEPDTFLIDPKQQSTYTVSPVTSYDERVSFAFIEDFETGNLFAADVDGNDSTLLVVQMEEVFEGSRAGEIHVNESQESVIVGTSTSFGPFFQRGPQAWLEFDIKNEVPLTVGYSAIDNFGQNVTFSKVTMLPNENWRKVYVEFTEEFAGDNVEQVQILFRADLDARFTDVEEGSAYLDNVKLVHF